LPWGFGEGGHGISGLQPRSEPGAWGLESEKAAAELMKAY
jgi:hypothetical protein